MSDRCGYPAGQEHPHVEECHRAERARWVAEVEALAAEWWAAQGRLELQGERWESPHVRDLRALIERLGGEGT